LEYGGESGREPYDHKTDAVELNNLANVPVFAASTSALRKQMHHATPAAGIR
jgi:hypothetical protein